MRRILHHQFLSKPIARHYLEKNADFVLRKKNSDTGFAKGKPTSDPG